MAIQGSGREREGGVDDPRAADISQVAAVGEARPGIPEPTLEKQNATSMGGVSLRFLWLLDLGSNQGPTD